ncbi:MAG: ACP phosphodiesterase [Lachnospiraceae bacterium]|jgi:FMN-dependent NADH-azoreductase|nr:ACP phosphodiesterase [Lachnospiraceae bacterium]
MVLFVNACVRSDSRTRKLAEAVLFKISGDYEEIKLEDINFPKTDEAFLKKRDNLIAEQRFDDDSFAMARQFSAADTIVIAAPYWDLSFPAMLKQYIEHINVLGITFEYTPEGIPKGLCKAEKLYYVMTAGGNYVPEEFGFGYVKALAQNFYGIGDVELIKATGLDIYGADVNAIMDKATGCIS